MTTSMADVERHAHGNLCCNVDEVMCLQEGRERERERDNGMLVAATSLRGESMCMQRSGIYSRPRVYKFTVRMPCREAAEGMMMRAYAERAKPRRQMPWARC